MNLSWVKYLGKKSESRIHYKLSASGLKFAKKIKIKVTFLTSVIQEKIKFNGYFFLRVRQNNYWNKIQWLSYAWLSGLLSWLWHFSSVSNRLRISFVLTMDRSMFFTMTRISKKNQLCMHPDNHIRIKVALGRDFKNQINVNAQHR